MRLYDQCEKIAFCMFGTFEQSVMSPALLLPRVEGVFQSARVQRTEVAESLLTCQRC